MNRTPAPGATQVRQPDPETDYKSDGQHDKRRVKRSCEPKRQPNDEARRTNEATLRVERHCHRQLNHPASIISRLNSAHLCGPRG